MNTSAADFQSSSYPVEVGLISGIGRCCRGYIQIDSAARDGPWLDKNAELNDAEKSDILSDMWHTHRQ